VLRFERHPAAATPPAIPTRADLNLCRRTSKQANRESIAPRSCETSRKPPDVSALGLVLKTSNADRSPRHFKFGDGGIIDDIAPPQPDDGVVAFGESTGLKFRKLFNVDIERIEKQPAVRRIGAAIGRAVIEQRVQRIEADTIRP